MSVVDRDFGASVPGAGFGTTEIAAGSAATQLSWEEGLLMVVGTTAGVLAASSLAVWVYLT
jgi:hypothetical protein